MKLINTLFYILLGLIVIGGCKKPDNSVIRGNTVSLEFKRYKDIPDSSWIKIDDVLFIHTPHDFEWKTSAFLPGEEEGQYISYLPTSTVFYYYPGNTEKRFIEPFHNMNTMIMLSKKLKSYKYGSGSYIVKNPKELVVNGRLEITRDDNKPMNIQLSKDYPILVKVMN